MELAPVVLFVYNRPLHTRRTVESLLANMGSGESDLIVFSDAPKATNQEEEVRAVRQYVHQIKGFKSVTIVEQENNLGLARSIIDGVTSVVKKYGRVIVLEDDLVTSPYFLSFMNKALDVYQEEERVMHISGYMFPIDTSGLPETFFLRNSSCWGWATWNTSWEKFTKDPKRLLAEFTKGQINRFNMDGAYGFWKHVEQNSRGVLDTWAIFWYATVFEAGGLCLHPLHSLVSNIGHDGTGTHCGKSFDFIAGLTSKPITYFETDIVESDLALVRVRRFFKKVEVAFPRRLCRVVSRVIKKIFGFL